MKNKLFFAVALNLSLVATASAVKLSSSGVGEVIIVPYYTVQGDNETLLSITNVSDDVKAVKVRFLEAQNGKRVQSFNLYLPPNDVWTGSVQASGEGARVITKDFSCTEPVIKGTELVFFPTAYANDGGDSGLGRTREGFVEIIEMGVVTDPEIIDAVTFDQGTGQPPVDCDAVTNYWAKGGTWDTDPDDGMSGLTGGLMAEANIINVDDGVEYSQTLTVLEEFSDSTDSLHSRADVLNPSLDSASPAASTDPDDTWAEPEDAVSVLLMSESLYTVYTVNPVVDATTEWNITFPTKRFYTDLVGDKKPFTSAFEEYGAGEIGACEAVGIQYWNRETATAEESNTLDLCYAANIVRVVGAGGESNIFQPVWSGVDIPLAGADYPNGWAKIDFVTLADDAETSPTVDDYIDHIMKSVEGHVYAGLPSIGFSASRLVNKNVGVTDVGVAYAATAPHRAKRSDRRPPLDVYCSEPQSCEEFPLDDDGNGHFDKWISAGVRHVYSFKIPTPGAEELGNREMLFRVVDLGAEVSVNLGISEIRGKTVPAEGESDSCFFGPRIIVRMSAATEGLPCKLEFDTDYFLTIENTELENRGNYRLEYASIDY